MTVLDLDAISEECRPMTVLDLDAISEEFLNQCGPCDFGIDSTGCNCSKRDFRPAMLELVREVERLRTIVDRLVSLTYDTGGNELDADVDLPVGVFQQALYDSGRLS